MGIFSKPKLCKNCKSFNQITAVYGVQIGLCKTAVSTSTIFAGDFIFSKSEQPYNPEPIKVCGNFGCIRFERKPKK